MPKTEEYKTLDHKNQKEVVLFAHHCKRPGCYARWDSKISIELCPRCDGICITSSTVLGYQ